MNLTRRQFNALAIATAAVPVGSAFAQRAQFATPLPVPELIDTAKAGAAANLAVQKTRHAFVLGRPTAAYGVSASYLGPTIRIPASGDTQMNVRNALGRPTTLHWHGLLVPGNVDGGPQNVIANGALWRPVLPVKQPACSAWYHAHPHGNTAHQVYGGIAGMLILADGKDGERGLPHDYGIDDLPLVIQDRSFASDGALLYDASMPTTMFGYYGETVIVNGAIDPLARPPAKLVRLRLLNGANASTYRLGFSDGRTFHVCASDGGYLDAPIAVRDLLISPGERYEILVDFSDGRAVEFVTLPYQPAVRGGMGMMMRGIGSSQRRAILRFEPDGSRRKAGEKIPARLAALAAPNTASTAISRTLSLDMMMGMGRGMGGGMGGGMMGRGGAAHAINGRPFDMNRIDFTARQGSTEIWRVTAPEMPHPFHAHGTSFRVLSMNGRRPPPELAGLKDTVLVDGEVELLLPFDVAASREHPYMFHCHILEHEDGGMMGQFAVS